MSGTNDWSPGTNAAVKERFGVDVEHDRALVRICPVGEVDLDTVGQVATEIDRLRDAGFARIVVDLRRTTFLDSSGLHLILNSQAASSRDGWDFEVMAGPPQVQRTFEITGVLHRVRFLAEAPLPEARASLHR
jgi:anti-sigma B factor antagonist